MDRNSASTYALVAALLLILHRHAGLASDGNVPFMNLSLADPGVVTLVLLVVTGWLSLFALIANRGSTESGTNFLRWSVLATTAAALGPYAWEHLVPLAADAVKSTRIAIPAILRVGAAAVAGMLTAMGVRIFLMSAATMRSSKEMEEKGFHRFPPAATSAAIGGVFVVGVGLLTLWATFNFQEDFDATIETAATVSFWLPILFANLGSLLDFALLLVPGKTRKKALSRLRWCQECFDIHEMDYQRLGIVGEKAYREPLLLQAVKGGSNAAIEWMLNNGLDPDERSPRGWTPLMLAAAEGNDLAVQQLLSHGADPNVTNYAGRTGLMFASRYGYTDIVGRLLAAGASPDLCERSPSALTSASENGHQGVVELLLNAGAKAGLRDGSTPALCAAAGKGHREIVELLIAHEADFTAMDSKGQTALDCAMQSGNGVIAKILRTEVRNRELRGVKE